MRSLIAAGVLLASGASFAAPSNSLLDDVQQRGTLKVCTTGDYKPYTFLRDDKQYEGIDIAMAESLAKTLNVKIEWVPTTWKTLMPDFLAGNCDMGVGGISISLSDRRKLSSATRSRWTARFPSSVAMRSTSTRPSNNSTNRQCA